MIAQTIPCPAHHAFKMTDTCSPVWLTISPGCRSKKLDSAIAPAGNGAYPSLSAYVYAIPITAIKAIILKEQAYA